MTEHTLSLEKTLAEGSLSSFVYTLPELMEVLLHGPLYCLEAYHPSYSSYMTCTGQLLTWPVHCWRKWDDKAMFSCKMVSFSMVKHTQEQRNKKALHPERESSPIYLHTENKLPSIKPFQHTSRRKKALTLGRRKGKKFRQRTWGSNLAPLILCTSPLTTELSRQSRELFWTIPPYTSPMSVLHCWVTAMLQCTVNSSRHHKMLCCVRT